MNLIDPKNINFCKENIIGLNLSELLECDKTDYNSLNISIYFSSFERPKIMIDDDKLSTLNICVDNSFHYDTDDNIIFIDHHLADSSDKLYKSNANMMFNRYDVIYDHLSVLFNNYRFKNIKIFMHNDIDGICSGIMIKKILNDVFNGKKDSDYWNNLKLVQILGNYGDIDKEAKLGLLEIFNDEDMINIFDKKIREYNTALSRVFKAIRPLMIDNNSNIKIKYEEILSNENISLKDMYSLINDILNNIITMSNINIKSFLFFLNNLIQNKMINLILDIYNKETERLVNNYMSSKTPCYETTIIFKNDPRKTKFKLLIINTPFDCGRSVLWKYRSSLKYALSNCKTNKWKYNVTDWCKHKNLKELTENIACYNNTLNKLTLDGNNSSAFEIASNIFSGGGHDNLEQGKSIGSVVLNNIDELLEAIILVDLF